MGAWAAGGARSVSAGALARGPSGPQAELFVLLRGAGKEALGRRSVVGTLREGRCGCVRTGVLLESEHARCGGGVGADWEVAPRGVSPWSHPAQAGGLGGKRCM